MVVAIVPWNMPQFLIAGKLAPALLAGCPIIIKPAPETPLDALLLAELVDQLGLPAGLVSVLPGGREVGELLVGHPGVDKVAFTGSTAAGRQVAAACGASLTRVSLELGGKSAAIVLDDADPAEVAQGVRVAGLMNSGQACVAQTRVLVPNSRHDEYLDALATMVDGLPVGDPADRSVEIGPLVTQAPAGAGARLHRGGRAGGGPPGRGRRRIARGTGHRVVRAADPVRRRRQPHAHRPRGDLRPGPLGHPLRGRRGGRAHRQRLRLRPVRVGVDRRRRPGARGGPPGAHRVVRGQPALQHGSGRPVRRHEGQRHRSRARPRGPRGLPRGQGHLRRPGSRSDAG